MGRAPLIVAEKTCAACGEEIINAGAHHERCPGRPMREDFTGRYQCRRCLDTSGQGGFCVCGGRRYPVMRAHEGVWTDRGQWKESDKR